MKHISISVKGLVQGVFYRASARKTALQLGITGFVRNETDGSVFIQAEGSEEALEKFIAWCKEGPAHARVASIEINEIPEPGHYQTFEISR